MRLRWKHLTHDRNKHLHLWFSLIDSLLSLSSVHNMNPSAVSFSIMLHIEFKYDVHVCIGMFVALSLALPVFEIYFSLLCLCWKVDLIERPSATPAQFGEKGPGEMLRYHFRGKGLYDLVGGQILCLLLNIEIMNLTPIVTSDRE